MTGPSPDKATRPWRMRAYSGTGKTQLLVHEATYRGDQALNEAFKRYDRDPAISKVTAEQQW
ncbi:hypothetical protein GCM10028801_41460 [Nocardioides maradonensis]